MKKLLIVLTAFTAIACNDNDTKENNYAESIAKDSSIANETEKANTPTPASLKEVTQHYLELKNALANDNGKEAAPHGKAMADAIDEIDSTSFRAEQKMVFAMQPMMQKCTVST